MSLQNKVGKRTQSESVVQFLLKIPEIILIYCDNMCDNMCENIINILWYVIVVI